MDRDGLVTGAFVMPDEQDARHYALSSDDGAQVIRSLIAITQGIAVHPAHRREGIGLQIKLYCNSLGGRPRRSHHAVHHHGPRGAGPQP